MLEQKCTILNTGAVAFYFKLNTMTTNVLQLGEVATCTNLIINREVSVAILPNCC